ncbi:MAG: hypothetical protein GXO82_05435 [Chlorobi bacterium]|nr:hypothetical protein [Chlorobiota bacterium]
MSFAALALLFMLLPGCTAREPTEPTLLPVGWVFEDKGELQYACETADGSIVAGGAVTLVEPWNETGVLMRVESTGELRWRVVFDKESDPNVITRVKQTRDGGFIMIGVTSTGDTTERWWSMKPPTGNQGKMPSSS